LEQQAGGHIDVAYGIYDRPGPGDDDIFFEPIVPTEQVATQLAVNRPPIEDPDYSPTSKRDLTAAMLAIAEMIPQEEISKFYKTVHQHAEKIIDDELLKSNNIMGDDMTESKIHKLIREALDEDELQRQFDEEFGEVTPDEGTEEIQVQPDTHSLADVAQATGFSGPSGAKNFISRLLSRISRFANLPGEEIDAMIEFAAGEYIDLLEQSELIDAEDAALMLNNKTMVADLPSFKFFIYNALVQPAVKQLEGTGKKKVEPFLNKLKVSDRTKDSIMHQLLGQVPRNDELIKSRILDDQESGKISQEEALDAIDKLSASFEALKKLAMTGDDFVEIALQKYASLSKSKLMGIMRKASEDPYVAEKM